MGSTLDCLIEKSTINYGYRTEVPCYSDYMDEQKKWFEDNRYYLGIRKGQYVSSNEAFSDYSFNPTYYGDGLTVEQHFRLHYVRNRIIPAMRINLIKGENLKWAVSKLKDTISSGLFSFLSVEDQSFINSMLKDNT